MDTHHTTPPSHHSSLIPLLPPHITPPSHHSSLLTSLLPPHITPPSLTPDIIRLPSPRDGQTALHRAANSDQHEIVSLLLTEDPLCANIQDKDGNTALHLACRKAHKRTVNTLLVREHGQFSLQEI